LIRPQLLFLQIPSKSSIYHSTIWQYIV
jgi:hypothetical protein